jgi:hypothetical protein
LTRFRYARGEAFKGLVTTTADNYQEICQAIWNRQKLALGNAISLRRPTTAAEHESRLSSDAMEVEHGAKTSADEEDESSSSSDDDIERTLAARALIDQRDKSDGLDDETIEKKKKLAEIAEKRELTELGSLLNKSTATTQRKISIKIDGSTNANPATDLANIASQNPQALQASPTQLVRATNKPLRMVKRITRFLNKHGEEKVRVEFTAQDAARVEKQMLGEKKRRELDRASGFSLNANAAQKNDFDEEYFDDATLGIVNYYRLILLQ